MKKKCHLQNNMDSLQAELKKTMERLSEELNSAKNKRKEEIAVINAKYTIAQIFENALDKLSEEIMDEYKLSL